MGKRLIVLGLTLTLFRGGINAAAPTDSVLIYPNETISTNYIGNGVQWDPYQLDYGHGKMSISKEDWQKLYNRLDIMKPGFIRIMINTPSLYDNGETIADKDSDGLSPILDYCQSRNITVMFGDWGGSLIDSKSGTINTNIIDKAIYHLSYLINKRGYDCIKYYNFVNEPNGWWSSTKGNFNLWSEGMEYFTDRLNKSGLSGKVQMAAPDVAIWTDEDCWWIKESAGLYNDNIGVYDIHTYPSKYTVNSGEFYDIVKSYREVTPADKRIIMGEIGLKYVHPSDSVLDIKNKQRASEKPYASTEDSQMSVYDLSYGIDIADALVQTASAGYSGSIAWMLDDAMHSNESPDKLKVWGFWNILGEEFFGADEESIRPWYYSWSLLCRHMPPGSDVLESVVTNSKCRVNVIKSNNKYSIFIVNPNTEDVEATVKSESELQISNANVYIYREQSLNSMIVDGQIRPVETGKSLNLSNAQTFRFPARSMTVITNIIQ